jgi:hypothetical protein
MLAGQEPPDPTAAGLALRERAGAIEWRNDGDVTLIVEKAITGEEERIVPDATVSSRRRGVRGFMEIDRGSHATKRVIETLERYRRYLRDRYASDYPDGLKPEVAFVCRGLPRVGVIQRFGHLAGFHILGAEEAPRVLGALFFETAPPVAAATSVVALRLDPGAEYDRMVAQLYMELRAIKAHLPPRAIEILRWLRTELTRRKDGHADAA